MYLISVALQIGQFEMQFKWYTRKKKKSIVKSVTHLSFRVVNITDRR